jgi:hypothetical protein
MPLKFADDGSLKRTRGRPSFADREFERRLRAAAAAELARDLDPTLDDINSRRVPGTSRWRKGPPALTGRSLKLVGLVASGVSEEDARIAVGLQRRAIRRLLATSPLFVAALAGARAAAALSSSNSQKSLGALNAPGCVDTTEHEQGQ